MSFTRLNRLNAFFHDAFFQDPKAGAAAGKALDSIIVALGKPRIVELSGAILSFFLIEMGCHPGARARAPRRHPGGARQDVARPAEGHGRGA